MKKRIASLIMGGALATAAVMGFTGCGGSDDDDKKGGASNKLILWGPSAQQDSLQEMVDLFLEENPDFGLEIELGVAGEGDAYAMMSNDPEAGADVFAYANDQVVNLLSIGALARLTDSTVADLKATNMEDAVNAGKVGNAYYGYPYAADNGFFMYYDKSVISEDQAKTLEGVLQACKDAGKYLIYQVTTGWYAGSFIYGAGGEYTATYNPDTKKWTTNCNFDEKPQGSDYTYGELGGQALADLANDEYVVDGGDTEISNYLQTVAGVRGFGACISGTWNASAIKTALGDDYGATVLPTWKSSLDKKTYPWKSFAGYKLYGVNAYSKHIPEAHELAAFLSSQAMQDKRFDDNEIGPSNKTVAAMKKVQDNLAIATISKQFATNSVIQASMPKSYWTELESFGKAMKDLKGATISTDRVKELAAALRG